jgi:hypothetical protein
VELKLDFARSRSGHGPGQHRPQAGEESAPATPDIVVTAPGNRASSLVDMAFHGAQLNAAIELARSLG